MLWKKSVVATIPRAPQPLPDVAALRRAALQGSWQRDRWVARRRIALRWALWYLARLGLPVLLGLTAVAGVWLWVMPQIAAQSSPTVAIAPIPTAPPVGPEPAPPGEQDDPLPLQLDRRWATVAPHALTFTFTEDEALLPSLQSDYAMHSQEP